MPHPDGKYVSYPYGVDLPDPTWPGRRNERAPLSASVAQRRWVFRLDREGIVELAVENARRCREVVERLLPDTEVTFQYSPESFTSTEMDFAVEICDRVFDVWEPTPERKAIVNLP